jgi:hypothetical protein
MGSAAAVRAVLIADRALAIQPYGVAFTYW